MNPLVLQLIQAAAPLVMGAIQHYKAAHNGAEPTEEQLKAHLAENVQLFLGEGAAWKAAHPGS